MTWKVDIGLDIFGLKRMLSDKFIKSVQDTYQIEYQLLEAGTHGMVKDESPDKYYIPLWASDSKSDNPHKPPESKVAEANAFDSEAVKANTFNSNAFDPKAFNANTSLELQLNNIIAATEEHFLRSSPKNGGVWQLGRLLGGSQQGFITVEAANHAWAHALATGSVQATASMEPDACRRPVLPASACKTAPAFFAH
ncbi:hypothetical protein B0H34DRAFT_675127 [Crassisporium funariophilum]|nr:hypothetical protein B0H34DRAFT_675127 [Crassisporium funariophilum]